MNYDHYSFLAIDKRPSGVAVITMNRPDVLNAADPAGHDEMGQIWLDLGKDPEVKVALITGAGRGFSAGGDLSSGDPSSHDFIASTMREAAAIVYNLINLDKPVVSAINGPAVGAGTAVALLADISIASEKAKIIDGHTKLGVVAGDHSAIVWPLLCGMAKSKYYLLLCDSIDGREAERIGLVSMCVPAEELMSTAMDVAERLAAGSQWALQGTKRVLNNWLRMAGPIFDQSLALEMMSFYRPDMAEGVQAFTDRRPPEFPSSKVPARR